MITSMMNFPSIISTDATSSSIIHNVFFLINRLKIEICLTVTNKNKSDANKFYLLFGGLKINI